MYNIFLNIVERAIPRILGLGDRDIESATYGCFDRTYWHYKLIDFPNSRFQEAALILALLYHSRSLEKFAHNKKVHSLAIGAIDFVFSQQNKDGSFNEVYPFERSFCATSFVACAVAESMLLLGEKRWEAKLHKLGQWLSKHENPEVGNQMAAAATGLYLLHLLIQDKKFREASEQKIAQLRQRKGHERFFPEYGGLDVGYLSITVSLLATLWQYSRNDDIHKMAIDAAGMIEEHIDEDGRFDWSKMSRKTQFIYPYGFVVLDKIDALKKLKYGLQHDIILNPTWMDDRYCIAFTLDYLKTAIGIDKRSHPAK
jgi:hypothetical protein